MQMYVKSDVFHHVYLLQLRLSLLVSELHVEDLPLQATEELHLGALSFFSFLQLLQQFGQLDTRYFEFSA